LDYAQNVIAKQVDDQIKKKAWLEKKIDEYDTISKKVLELGQKSSHSVMVPICSVAYFPKGKIKHSNEFLVALGDNYFIERTSQECQPIIERRVQKLELQIKAIDT
jgi:prefoldin alpha subunit